MTNRTWLQPLAIALFFLSLTLQAQQPCQPPTPVLRENIFTEEQEMWLGEAIAEHIQRNFSVVQNDELTADLRRLGERLSKHLPPHKLRFQFFLIESSDANAFVLPGGRIYVTRKLIAFVQTEDELAGVLAHEMGHMIARQGASDMTRLWREVLKVTQVTDRQDIFTKYNQLVDNAARNPKAFAKLDSHEDKDQVVADQIGLYAMASAGFDPTAFSRFFDRLAETKGKTGGFFSDLFGVTNPNAKRLREMIRAQGNLPASCIEARSQSSHDDFKKWQQAVIAYSGDGRKEALRGVLSKTVLEPALRGDVTHLRFSPDGKYVIAQDDSGINVISREPFKTLFRIAAPEATNAQFTPDSQQIVFYNSDLRVETWSLAEQKMKEVHELYIRNQCVQSQLSPDGKTLACLDGEMALNLY
ncbi:MAG TPA: M48 family metalloprotease, partial [Blastocatellia bacterium]|nr:M48 family metalloprotease [Blastocatellia bacterium]